VGKRLHGENCAELFGILEAESFWNANVTRPLERSESLSRCLDPWAIRWPSTLSGTWSDISRSKEYK